MKPEPLTSEPEERAHSIISKMGQMTHTPGEKKAYDVGEEKTLTKSLSGENEGKSSLMGKNSWSPFWQIGAFRVTVLVSILFFVLIAIAMLLYPGGTLTNPHSHGYSFFLNFLSDLGRFSSPSGQSNLASMILFTIALSLGALGIALFFFACIQLFTPSGIALRLSRLGAGCGLIASICFLGVASVPLDLNERMHNFFLDSAFVSFLIAFLLIYLAVLFKPGLPRRFVGIFTAFAVVLTGYSLLLACLLLFGPAAGTPTWEIIQATGQKVIVSASILTALIQALSIPPLLLRSAKLPSNP